MSPDSPTTSGFFSGKRAHALMGELDRASVPAHVAIIMDGNGRWAAKRGMPRIAGHRAGAKAVREAIACCIELGIAHLTIYSFSSENWRRPTDEVSGLMSLFVEVLERELDNLGRMNVRVSVIGESSRIPGATAKAFERCVEATRSNSGLNLIVALDYGGRSDIVNAARTLAEQAVRGEIDPTEIDERMVSSRLSTAGIPDPDLVIRTSGEIRVSNFLLWEIAYAEFWVTPTLWPDFSRNDLLRAVVDFQRRERRFGGSS